MRWLFALLVEYFNQFTNWLVTKFTKKTLPPSKELPSEKEESFSLTLRGAVVCSVMFQGPLSLEDLIKLHPNEKFEDVVVTINELIETGAITVENGLLKEGNALHDPA